jgi:hypothetical protein
MLGTSLFLVWGVHAATTEDALLVEDIRRKSCKGLIQDCSKNNSHTVQEIDFCLTKK